MDIIVCLAITIIVNTSISFYSEIIDEIHEIEDEINEIDKSDFM